MSWFKDTPLVRNLPRLDSSDTRFAQMRSRVARRVMGSLPPRLSALFEEADYSVGIGPIVGGGAVLGGSLSGGLILHRDGIGYYGSLGFAVGLLAGFSVGVHVTVVRGGADVFLGLTRAVGVTVAPTFTGAMLLYNRDRHLLGASVAASIGTVLPLELYVGVVRTFGRGR